MHQNHVPHHHYSHDLLLHHDDDELVNGTRAFVEQGLASGGSVLVHGTRDRVDLMRDALGTHPQLEYGFDADLYQAPNSTLFAYQRKLSESPAQTEVWATGTVPLGRDPATQAAWARYESAVNEALSAYPFHGLCTYDVQTLPASVIEAARATHPTVLTDQARSINRDYTEPQEFLAHPLARAPELPASSPTIVTTLDGFEDLARVRRLVAASVRSSSAVSLQTIDDFLVAVNEVAENALVHGGAPVQIVLWADLTTLTCQVVDSGPRGHGPMAGYRHPSHGGSLGLWAARQLADDLFISNTPGGGCVVVMTRA